MELKGPDPEGHGSFVANPSGKNAKMEVQCQKKCALENRSRLSAVRKPRELGAPVAQTPRGDGMCDWETPRAFSQKPNLLLQGKSP